MPVWERKGKRGSVWNIAVAVGTERVRKALPRTVKTEAQAKQTERWVLVQLEAGVPANALDVANHTVTENAIKRDHRMTLEHATERALEREWSDRKTNVSFFASVCALMTEYFGADTPLADLKDDQIWSWVRDMKAGTYREGTKFHRPKPLKAATINAYLAVLGRLLRLAHEEWTYPNGSPVLPHALSVRRHRQKNRNTNRIRCLDFKEEDALLEYLRNSERPRSDAMAELVAVLIDTGFRVSEMLNAGPRHFSPGENTLTAADTKNDEPRRVPLTQRARAIIERRVNEAQQPWLDADGNPPVSQADRLAAMRQWGTRLFPEIENWEAARREWDNARAALGMAGDPEFVIHALRHTCATRMAFSGIDTRTIQVWLGHRDITQTQVYTNLVTHHLTRGAAALEKRPE